MNSLKIEAEYNAARATPTDINEHIETLFELATECDSVVEGGVRYVVSSWAFIYGCACRGGQVDSYCWNMIPEIQRAIDICREAQVPWTFHEGDWLKQEIPPCDLLFIDTNHFYSQLKGELRLHAPKSRRYIALHDTVRFGKVSQDEKPPGLWQAIEEFISQGGWAIRDHYENCNGLTVLEKVDED